MWNNKNIGFTRNISFLFLALMVMTVSLHLAVTQAAVTYLTSEEPRPHANIVHRDDLSRDNHSVEGGTSRGRYVLNQNIGSLFRLLFGDTFLLPLPQRHSDCVISPAELEILSRDDDNVGREHVQPMRASYQDGGIMRPTWMLDDAAYVDSCSLVPVGKNIHKNSKSIYKRLFIAEDTTGNICCVLLTAKDYANYVNYVNYANSVQLLEEDFQHISKNGDKVSGLDHFADFSENENGLVLAKHASTGSTDMAVLGEKNCYDGHDSCCNVMSLSASFAGEKTLKNGIVHVVQIGDILQFIPMFLLYKSIESIEVIRVLDVPAGRGLVRCSQGLYRVSKNFSQQAASILPHLFSLGW